MNIKYTNEIPTNKKKLVTNNPVVNTVAKQLEIYLMKYSIERLGDHQVMVAGLVLPYSTHLKLAI